MPAPCKTKSILEIGQKQKQYLHLLFSLKKKNLSTQVFISSSLLWLFLVANYGINKVLSTKVLIFLNYKNNNLLKILHNLKLLQKTGKVALCGWY